MQISESLWETMPENLRLLFSKTENPDREEVLAGFPDRKTTWVSPDHANNRSGEFLGELKHPGSQGFNDSGSASRFFFNAVDEEEYMILNEQEYNALPENLKPLFQVLPNPEKEEVVQGFPETKSGALNQASITAKSAIYGEFNGYSDPKQYTPDQGSASRFFYCAKASRRERNAGLEDKESGVGTGNSHPT